MTGEFSSVFYGYRCTNNDSGRLSNIMRVLNMIVFVLSIVMASYCLVKHADINPSFYL